MHLRRTSIVDSSLGDLRGGVIQLDLLTGHTTATRLRRNQGIDPALLRGQADRTDRSAIHSVLFREFTLRLR